MNSKGYLWILCWVLVPAILLGNPVAIRLNETINPIQFFHSYNLSISENTYSKQNLQSSKIREEVFPAFPTNSHPVLKRWYMINLNPFNTDILKHPAIEVVDTLPRRWVSGSADGVIRQLISSLSSNSVTNVTDPYAASQWHLERIYATYAWNVTRGNPNVTIGVIDVGIDINHPDLSSQLFYNQSELNGQTYFDDDNNGFIDDRSGWDFLEWDNDPRPPDEQEFHGTHVAGIALAANNGQFGIGVAPNVKLLPLRAGQQNSIIAGYQALYYCGIMGVDIINCSWGGEAVSAIEADAVRFALERGCTIFASAGNDGTNNMLFPASLPGVISVGATNRYDEPAQFSNTNMTISIWAPGTGIPAPLPNQGWGLLSGTSMASPVAAGVGALVKSLSSQFNNFQIRNILAMSGDPMVQRGNRIEARVNAWRALQEANTVSSTFQNVFWSGTVQGGGLLQLNVPLAFQNPFYSPFTLYGNELIGATWVANQVSMTPSPNHQVWNGVLRFRLPVILRRGHSVQTNFLAVADNGYRCYGSALTRLAPPEVTLNDGRILATFSTIGAMGLMDPYTPLPVGQSLQVPPGNPGVLYHGSFLLAIRNTVLDNVWGNDLTSNDWEVPLTSNISIIGTPPQHVEAIAQPLSAMGTYNVRVRWIANCVSNQAGLPAIDISAEIQNQSGSLITNVIAAWLFDFDIFIAGSNTGRVWSNLNFATMGRVNHAEQYGVWLQGTETAGVLRVPPTSALWQNWGDQRKYELLTWTGFDNDRLQPDDYSILLATIPFQIPAFSSRNFSIRLFYAPNQSIAEEKVRQWRSGGSVHQNSPTEQSQLPKITLHHHKVSIEGAKDNSTLVIYNVLGREVTRYKIGSQNQTIIPLHNLPTGVYFLKYLSQSSPSNAQNGKVEIVKKVVFLQED
ncbi:MAG: S8 family peptidase [bacterium]|nr:S8 family peptidase [bacterium]